MDKAIFIASDGAKQAMLAMRANSQNLANANTPGFKSDLVRFTAFPVENGVLNSRAYTIAGDGGFDLTAGTLAATKRPLDVAIRGDGWISVQRNGKEALTRAGNLQVALNGTLMTADGDPVMGNKGLIAIPPNQGISIAADGTINVLPIGSTDNVMDKIDRIKLVNPKKEEIVRGNDGLFYPAGDTTTFPANAKVEVISGMLEGSNVNSVEVLTKLVELSRYYETQVKLMTTVESNANKAVSIIQIQ